MGASVDGGDSVVPGAARYDMCLQEAEARGRVTRFRQRHFRSLRRGVKHELHGRGIKERGKENSAHSSRSFLVRRLHRKVLPVVVTSKSASAQGECPLLARSHRRAWITTRASGTALTRAGCSSRSSRSPLAPRILSGRGRQPLSRRLRLRALRRWHYRPLRRRHTLRCHLRRNPWCRVRLRSRSSRLGTPPLPPRHAPMRCPQLHHRCQLR